MGGGLAILPAPCSIPIEPAFFEQHPKKAEAPIIRYFFRFTFAFFTSRLNCWHCR